MTKRKLQHIRTLVCLAALALLSACTDGYEADAPSADDGKLTVRLFAPDYEAQWSEGSRALNPMKDELQKKIHNLMYFFYDKNNLLQKVYYQNLSPRLVHEVTFSKFPHDAGLDFEGTLFVIANAENMEGDTGEEVEQLDADKYGRGEWIATIDNVVKFKKEAVIPVYYAHQINTPQPDDLDSGLPGHMIMFGYFQGVVHEKEPLNVVMGRVAVRMRVALSGPGLGNHATVTVKNVPTYTSLFDIPLPETMLGLWPNEEGKLVMTEHSVWVDFKDEDLSVGKGILEQTDDGEVQRTASLFYYCGENKNPIEAKRTTLVVETWNADENGTKSAEYTYEVVLGHDGPDVPEAQRDFSLYRNNSYTFNISLQVNSRAGEQSRSTDESGSIYLYPVAE